MRAKNILVFGIFLLMETIYSQAANNTKLTIRVQGIKNKKGTINIALFKSDTDFNQEKFTYVSRTPADSNGIIIFDKIDYGNYSVAVYHDENENQKLDRNFIGMPKEGYGFSNNVKGKMGPPAFKDTSVIMNQAETNLSIQLNY
ncbi:MAG: DUF2141 domain-containing protein [Leptospiraceae bacterium]|nr:DUF2141 domain-containing protein [Leptospiraceae bacterium]MBK7057518.1 DUF2141 domain-containing protein [Leptospiraceae bacterium]MBK9500601.1 DUF2141 domain-containing protein [Leptospiraceae bacterium]MBL0264936.1 DUF2141 domain-containing protein [Leptospiraceae bacterium]MBP9163499.1 DUF2141 domain-containing protein [Leptospiraceae bacterium]